MFDRLREHMKHQRGIGLTKLSRRSLAVRMWLAGMSAKEIFTLCNVPFTIVSKWLSEWKEDVILYRWLLQGEFQMYFQVVSLPPSSLQCLPTYGLLLHYLPEYYKSQM